MNNIHNHISELPEAVQSIFSNYRYKPLNKEASNAKNIGKVGLVQSLKACKQDGFLGAMCLRPRLSGIRVVLEVTDNVLTNTFWDTGYGKASGDYVEQFIENNSAMQTFSSQYPAWSSLASNCVFPTYYLESLDKLWGINPTDTPVYLTGIMSVSLGSFEISDKINSLEIMDDMLSMPISQAIRHLIYPELADAENYDVLPKTLVLDNIIAMQSTKGIFKEDPFNVLDIPTLLINKHLSNLFANKLGNLTKKFEINGTLTSFIKRQREDGSLYEDATRSSISSDNCSMESLELFFIDNGKDGGVLSWDKLTV